MTKVIETEKTLKLDDKPPNWVRSKKRRITVLGAGFSLGVILSSVLQSNQLFSDAFNRITNASDLGSIINTVTTDPNSSLILYTTLHFQ